MRMDSGCKGDLPTSLASAPAHAACAIKTALPINAIISSRLLPCSALAALVLELRFGCQGLCAGIENHAQTPHPKQAHATKPDQRQAEDHVKKHVEVDGGKVLIEEGEALQRIPIGAQRCPLGRVRAVGALLESRLTLIDEEMKAERHLCLEDEHHDFEEHEYPSEHAEPAHEAFVAIFCPKVTSRRHNHQDVRPDDRIADGAPGHIVDVRRGGHEEE
mmetsp:Transcript_18683/g.53569  ORF Transcript_18683/g.53569 Transcript_18683/m.53569 type:complete len:218 (+) Transcript_18683:80-733(+)